MSDRLWAARLTGACAIGIVGWLALRLPVVYLGSTAAVARLSTLYAVLAVAVGGAAVAARLGGRRWASLLGGALLIINVTVFLPALPGDPLIAGGVVLWHLLLLGRLLAPAEGGGRWPGHRREDVGEVGRWIDENRHALQHLLLVSLALTVTVVGFEVGGDLPARVACLALDAVTLLLTAPLLVRLLGAGSRLPLVLAAPLLAAVLTLGSITAVLAWVAVFQVLVVAVLVHRSTVANDLIAHFVRRPALLVATSFVVIIAVGTLLLSFPAAAASGRALAPVDALFTATSAACVTGLIVVDTPTAFSGFGHTVILGLIQLGGWNIMVLSAFSALLLGRGLGLRGERALGELLDMPMARTARRLAGFIVAATVLIEALGALLLAEVFHTPTAGWLHALWLGCFHSVSAFCNAGFSLQSDSLVRLAAHPLALLVFAAEIILGGLGFAVLAAAWNRLRGGRGGRASFHVRVALWASAILVAVGTAWMLAAEWNGVLAGMSVGERVSNALFLAVTPRTAGFNNVDVGALSSVSLLLVMAFMFIGASPGGTGGGVKTTTAVVLLGSITAIVRGEARIRLLQRTVPLETVYRSAAITAIALLVAFLGTATLLAVEGHPLVPAMFEVLSALGTVGLTLGVTQDLGVAGKLVIAAVMLIGRIGPLALALILGRATSGRLSYPEARIMVG